jgi:hypothetical protein
VTIEQIMAWLDSKGVTLWGTFDLSQPERKLQAAIWFYTQMQDLAEFGANQPLKTNLADRWDVV